MIRKKRHKVKEIPAFYFPDTVKEFDGAEVSMLRSALIMCVFEGFLNLCPNRMNGITVFKFTRNKTAWKGFVFRLSKDEGSDR